MDNYKEYLIQRSFPFRVSDLSFFACQYDPDKISFSNCFSEPKIPYSLLNAKHKRKVEFLSGRYCAINALKQKGIFQFVCQNTDGTPQWPESIVGSITHTKQLSMAAVGSKEKWLSLGIDSEFISNETNIASFAEQFISPNESFLGMEQGFLTQIWQYTVFSAKESIFKCLYPLVKKYFGFFDVKIISVNPINESQGSLCIQITKDLNPLGKNFLINCLYTIESNYVHTFVALE